MNGWAASAELVQAYESLRAQATGQISATMPRGLAMRMSSPACVWVGGWSSRRRGF